MWSLGSLWRRMRIVFLLLLAGQMTIMIVSHSTSRDATTRVASLDSFGRRGLCSTALVSVDAGNGTLIDRIRLFNRFLDEYRRDIIVSGNLLTTEWKLPNEVSRDVIRGEFDEYVTRLERNYAEYDVTTIVLPWKRKAETAGSDGVSKTVDTANQLLETYHRWTADEVLCPRTAVTPAVVMNAISVYSVTSSVNVSSAPAALTRLSPRNLCDDAVASLMPAHVDVFPPTFVSFLHVHRNAVVTSAGDVHSGNMKLVMSSCCAPEYNPELPANISDRPLYDEVFVVSQNYGQAVFHRMVDIAPRLVLYLDFLRANPSIRYSLSIKYDVC